MATSVDEQRSDEVRQPMSTWYFEIGVAADEHGRLIATGEPAIVPPPTAPARPPRVDGPALAPPLPGDEVIATVEAFLQALLAGDGDISRYLAPGFDLVAVTPAPFSTVVVDRVAVSRTDDHGARMRAAVAATSATGAQRSLGYEIHLATRAGRWEVTAVSGAPSLDPDRSAPLQGSAPSVASQPGA